MQTREVMIPVSHGQVSLHTIISTPSIYPTSPALLFLHFWGGSNATFDRLTPLLDRHSIIAPTLRGWGASSRPAAVQGKGYRIKDHVQDVVDLLLHLQRHEPGLVRNGVVLIGHSMGGKIAQVLTSRSETREMIKGLVLLAPAPAGAFALPTEEMRQQQIHAYETGESASLVVENVLIGRRSTVDRKLAQEIAAGAVSGHADAKHAWPGSGMAEEFEQEVQETLKARPQPLPVLILVGEDDVVETPARVEEKVVAVLREAGAEVDFHQVPAVGHLLPIEAPSFLSQRIQSFVQRIP